MGGKNTRAFSKCQSLLQEKCTWSLRFQKLQLGGHTSPHLQSTPAPGYCPSVPRPSLPRLPTPFSRRVSLLSLLPYRERQGPAMLSGVHKVCTQSKNRFPKQPSRNVRACGAGAVTSALEATGGGLVCVGRQPGQCSELKPQQGARKAMGAEGYSAVSTLLLGMRRS